MVRSFGKLFILALAISCVAVGSEAKAGWWHHGCSGGSWGCSGGSSGGSWGSNGCCGYAHHRLFHHSCGSWGGCYTATYTSCGCSGGFYSNASCGGYGCYGGATYYSNSCWGETAAWGVQHPVNGYASSVVPSTTIVPSASNDRATSGTVTVSVPADAKVWVNGMLTKSKGTSRQYISHGLEAGATYQYVVKVEVERGGETKTETKTVTLLAGSTSDLAFTFTDSESKVASTEF